MAGANAADKIITSANTCTVDVLGVSDNNATANTIATWDLIDYTLNPGQYLNVTETSVDKTTCPAGSYCVGGGYTVENASGSVASCPTNYPSSAPGAGAQTQCYTACTVATANLAHATAVGGNDYFGTGTDTCYATACDKGYHVEGGVELIEKTPLIPVDVTIGGTDINDIASISLDNSRNNKGTEYGLTEKGTWASKFDYGTVYGKASCQPKVNEAYIYIMSNVNAVMGGSMSIEEFRAGLEPLAGKAKTDLVIGIGMDIMNGTKTEEDFYKAVYALFGIEPNANYNIEATGQYCYCQLDRFIPAGGENVAVTSAPWVYLEDLDTTDFCASNCANECAILNISCTMYDCEAEPHIIPIVNWAQAYRFAAYGVLGYTETGTCSANTINIDWNPDNGGVHTQNMCTYDGEITLPTPDPVKPGYTFMGWKLVE